MKHDLHLLLCAIGVLLSFGPAAASAADDARLNVVLIMTDDQGWGDFGTSGNEKIRTPALDRLARQSVTFDSFYVSPVCAPTRACLMTGRYNYRTGAVDTFLGRAMMHPDEVTIAEMLGSMGYRTGIFGKWHLGDNYPLRAIDQGFHEALVHKGGGIGQPSDPPGGDHYQDATLYHNGRPVKTNGYCSDVYTDTAIRFIKENCQQPFFVYLPFNCPHTPLEIADRYVRPYAEMGLDDRTAKIYGMIENIDENIGRLMATLDELRLAENTLVIFITDNGPNGRRYNGPMRGIKGSVLEGGIRTVCFVRWPRRLRAGAKVTQIAAHIDITPTILDAAQVVRPAVVSLDGVSLLPLLLGQTAGWPDRTLYLQWHRGDQPQPYRAFAARSPRYKLVQPEGSRQPVPDAARKLMLFDMQSDRFEGQDIAAENPEIVARMAKDYEAWFRSVSQTRGFDPPRIHLGTPHENPVVLTRQDWRGPQASWRPEGFGHWEVHTAKAATYDITLRFPPDDVRRAIHFRLGDVDLADSVPGGARYHTFDSVALATGDGRLDVWLAAGQRTVGVHYVEVRQR